MSGAPPAAPSFFAPSPPQAILIENCHWGGTVPNATWCPWNYFRTSGDVRARYDSIVGNLQTTIQWAKSGLSAPGCWGYPDVRAAVQRAAPFTPLPPPHTLTPNPHPPSLFPPPHPHARQMLEVGCAHGPGGAGDPGLTMEETRAHFGAWCIVSSPLILSHDVNNATIMDAIWPIIANKEALAVNQAWAGFSGSVFAEASGEPALHFKEGGSVGAWQFWYKPVGGGKVAVLMMNHAATPATLSLPLATVPGVGSSTSFAVRDIWAQKDLGVMSNNYTVTLNTHDAAFLMITPQ